MVACFFVCFYFFLIRFFTLIDSLIQPLTAASVQAGKLHVCSVEEGQMISCPFRLHSSEAMNISLEFPLLKDFWVRADHYLL